jgi:hypothetical protein
MMFYTRLLKAAGNACNTRATAREQFMNAAEEVAQLLYSKTAALFPFSLLWLQ